MSVLYLLTEIVYVCVFLNTEFEWFLGVWIFFQVAIGGVYNS